MTGDNTSNNRVTIRELQETERRIMTELKPLSAMIHRVERNEKEIEALRNRSNVIDGINALLALILATVAAAFGKEP